MSETTTLVEREGARSMSLFEIDEALDLLIHGAEEEAEANSGQVPEQLKTAIMEYFEAHLRKVDRIAAYIRAQDAEAQIAAREIERLQARQKAAKNRADRTRVMPVLLHGLAGNPAAEGRAEHDHPAGQ